MKQTGCYIMKFNEKRIGKIPIYTLIIFLCFVSVSEGIENIGINSENLENSGLPDLFAGEVNRDANNDRKDNDTSDEIKDVNVSINQTVLESPQTENERSEEKADYIVDEDLTKEVETGRFYTHNLYFTEESQRYVIVYPDDSYVSLKRNENAESKSYDEVCQFL